MTIPQTDPLAGYIAHRSEIDLAMEQCLESGHYVLGPQVTEFERELGDYLGGGPAVGVASGTDALVLALRGTGVRPGDRVATVSHTSVATVVAVELVGAIPVLVDIDPATYTMDPARLEEVVSRSGPDRPLKAVLPVHLYGHPADMAEIGRIAREHELIVVEDCAQALGAQVVDRQVGSLGDAAAFSFYPTKNLGAIGDGGAVCGTSTVTDSVRTLRQYGWRERFVSERPGINSRLDELQAAILRVKLRYLDAENERRRAVAQMYDDALGTLPIRRPSTREGFTHVFHQYVIRVPERDRLLLHLKDAGVSTSVHYPVPIHLQPAYQGRAELGDQLDVTEAVCGEILSLPMYPEIRDTDVETVVAAIAGWTR